MTAFDRSALSDDFAVVLVGQMLSTIELQAFEPLERWRRNTDDERVQVGLIERSNGIGIEIENADLSLARDDLSDVVERRTVEIAIVLAEFHERVIVHFRGEVRFSDEMIVDVGRFVRAYGTRGVRNSDVEKVRFRLEETTAEFVSANVGSAYDGKNDEDRCSANEDSPTE